MSYASPSYSSFPLENRGWLSFLALTSRQNQTSSLQSVSYLDIFQATFRLRSSGAYRSPRYHKTLKVGRKRQADEVHTLVLFPDSTTKTRDLGKHPQSPSSTAKRPHFPSSFNPRVTTPFPSGVDLLSLSKQTPPLWRFVPVLSRARVQREVKTRSPGTFFGEKTTNPHRLLQFVGPTSNMRPDP